MVAQAAAARRAGLEALFVGDHHVPGVPYYQNTPLLGRLLAEWGDRPAGALYLLPLWHPVLLAEQVATLASIASGPFVLQCAIGAGEAQFAAMGADLRRRSRVFGPTLEIVRRLLAGEAVDADEPVRVRGARLALLPPEPVPVWVAARAPAAVERAARLGDGWIAHPGLAPKAVPAQLSRYVDACTAHGRPPGVMAIRRDVHVGADRADARRVADPILAAGYRGFPEDAAIVGGPSEVADAFAELGEAGFTVVIVRHLADDHHDVLASFERLAMARELVT